MGEINKKINIGIMGMGSIAERSVLPAFLKLKDKFNIIAISTKNNKDKIPKERNGIEIYSSYEELLENRNIDAIYISLINSLHYEFNKDL